MTHMLTAFERPVTVFIGLGFPRQIDDAAEAYELLADVPERVRGPGHAAAVKACRAAMDGQIEADTARGVFEAYARARGILADDGFANIPLAVKEDLLRA